MILTDDGAGFLKLWLNADEAPLSHMSVEEAEKYAEEGQFGTSSMLPKIDAALSFLKAGQKPRGAIINATMAKAGDAVNGKDRHYHRINMSYKKGALQVHPAKLLFCIPFKTFFSQTEQHP
ncbi:MAG: hypothetical protein ACLUD2_19210 [Clostridium sp.]